MKLVRVLVVCGWAVVVVVGVVVVGAGCVSWRVCARLACVPLMRMLALCFMSVAESWLMKRFLSAVELGARAKVLLFW